MTMPRSLMPRSLMPRSLMEYASMAWGVARLAWAYARLAWAYARCILWPKLERAYRLAFGFGVEEGRTAAFGVEVGQQLAGARTITRVIMFNEDEDAADVYFRDITPIFDPATWFQDLRERGVDWSFIRVEVRYTQLGHKYRAILRPGDVFRTETRPPNALVFLRRPVRARLLPKEPDAHAPLDITARLLKYAGACYDYHISEGLFVMVADLMPFDFWAGEWCGLEVVDGMGRRLVFEMQEEVSRAR